MTGLDSYNMEKSTKTKATQFSLYDKLDPDNYLEEAVLKKIVPGKDGRKVVRDTTIHPFSAQGRLVMIFNRRETYGSGTLICSRYMLTVAHNLYSKHYKREPDSILFLP
jgi:V8-like Glu-specific endopeptidase